MKRYIIKETSIGTEENPNFAGEVQVWLHGVGDNFLSAREFSRLSDWFIYNYGYKRKCDAKRNWTYKNPENTKFWQSEVEIIEFEI